jgi:hypothetical protein
MSPKQQALNAYYNRDREALERVIDSLTRATKELPMSYSFSLRAPTKTEAKEKVFAEYNKIVMPGYQPCHVKDREQAQAAVFAFIDILPDDANHDVSVSVSGSLSGTWAGMEIARVTGANISIGCSLAAREVKGA